MVEMPDGRRVRGRGLRPGLPDGPPPAFGVYLVGKDPGPFEWVRANYTRRAVETRWQRRWVERLSLP